MRPDAARPTSRLLVAGLAVAIVVVVLPGFWTALSYDEAYNLQIVGNLLHGHGYATDGALFAGRPKPFDYFITTGPTLMLPVFTVTAVLGEHVWVYRIAPTLIYLGLLLAWWSVGRQLAGPRLSQLGGAAAVLGLLSLDTAAIVYDSRFGAGTVIGESAATLGVLMAIVLRRRPGWAGLCFGLAVLTKVIVLLALPGIIVALVLHAQRPGALRAVGKFVAAAVAPVLAWQAVRILAMGWTDAMAANGDFLAFLRRAGAGAPRVGPHINEQIGMIGVAGLAAVLLVAGVALAGTAFEVYWLALESQYWVRHSTQAAQLLVPLILVLGVRALASLARPVVRQAFSIGLAALVLIQVSTAARTAWLPPGPSLADQRHVAELVAEHGTAYHFVAGSMVPELSLLDPALEPRKIDTTGGLLVLSGMSGRVSPGTCDHVLEEYADYVICDVLPGKPVVEFEPR
jgi:hypothetical protein